MSLDPFTLPASRPDWNDLLTDWRPLIPQDASPWLLTKFGEVFFVQSNDRIGMLQSSIFKYEVVATNQTDFLDRLVDPDKTTDWFLAALLSQLEASGKHLKPDYCYSFITPLALGGQLKLDNIMAIPIPEHFKLGGEIYQQIKDLPDGAQIVFEVD